jgi:hypothetical protein
MIGYYQNLPDPLFESCKEKDKEFAETARNYTIQEYSSNLTQFFTDDLQLDIREALKMLEQVDTAQNPRKWLDGLYSSTNQGHTNVMWGRNRNA